MDNISVAGEGIVTESHFRTSKAFLSSEHLTFLCHDPSYASHYSVTHMTAIYQSIAAINHFVQSDNADNAVRVFE